ncbi:4'-phosphopantetheinyl transferase family protein [Catenulispora yoronensis]
MMDRIAGPFVAVADTREDLLDAGLFPEEEESVARAVPKRRREYTTARACARQAMAKLGVPPVPILSGPRGEPRWPDRVVGSMTHCDGYRGAVVGWSSDVTAIGIDAEPNAPLPDQVLEAVSLEAERSWIAELTASRPETAWDRLLFSAKESVYKAWFPLTNKWLDFDNALITVDPEQGTFHARLLVPGPEVHGGPLTAFRGRWTVAEGIVLTAIVLTPPGSPPTGPPGS